MKSISKFSILVFAFFFVSTDQMIGQDSLVTLTESWLQLKNQLQRRSDIAIHLESVINNSGKKDKVILETVRSTATDLSLFIDSTRRLDSITVQSIYHKNNNLSQALSKALGMLIDDPKLKTQEEFGTLLMQLEGMENRILVAQRNFNETCIKHVRPDLLFGKTQTKKSPQVSF